MKKFTFIFLAGILCNTFTKAQIVTTLAGTINAGSGNGTGSAVGFSQPTGLVCDGAGNLYVADQNNNEIRKIVISTGVVSLFAGSVNAGSGNGTGSMVSFNQPEGLALDGNGNLFVSELNNNDIRKIVIATGAVTTLAGNLTAGSTNGTGTAALFSAPSGLASDGTNLYVADHSNNEIRQIVISTGVVTTLAGSTTLGHANGTGTAASFYYPYGIVYDGSGNLYVAEQDNNDIRKIVIATGVVTTLAGCQGCTAGTVNGVGTTATFNTPYGIGMDGNGNLYVGDVTNDEVRKIVISSATVSTYAGTTTSGSANGTGTAAGFHAPNGIATDGNGNVYVADQLNNEIRKVATAAPVVVFTASDSVPCSGTSISFYDQSMNTPTSWHWTFTGGTPATSTAQNPTVVYNSAGNFTAKLVATNAYGSDSLTKTNFIIVTATPTITVTPPSPAVCMNSPENMTASGASSYTWSPSTYLNNPSNASVTATPFNLGNVTYTVNGVANGCAGTATVTLVVNPVPSAPTLGSNSPLCSGNALNLTSTATGATYNWTGPNAFTSNVQNPSISNTTVAALGTYSLTETSSAGCTSPQATVAVTVNATPTVSISSSNPSVCPGGSSSLTANGANSYVWTAASSLTNISMGNATATPSVTTTYSVTGTAVNNCSSGATTVVKVEVLAISMNTVNESCNGLTNGNITALVTGGTPTYTYLWNTGSTAKLIYNLSTGGYTVTAKDSIGCTATATTTVTQPTALTVSASSTNTGCNKTNGTVTATPTGGVAPYNYSWTTTPAETGATVTGLASGTYSVTLTDGTGCTANATATVAASSGPVITPTITNSTCGNKNGKATLAISGGTPPYRYSWNNGDTLSTDSNMAAATYVITVTDASGCLTFEPININDATGPTINTSSVTNVSCNGGSNGAITLNVTGGAGGYKYKWSNGATTASISGLQSGPYLITVTDAGGCVAVNTINITEPAVLAANVSTTATGCGASTGGAGIAVSGGTSPYAYLWSTGATVYNLTNVAAGTYTVTVTDKAGCTLTDLASVVNTSGPLVTLDSVIDMNCSTKTLGQILITATGGTPPYNYLWSNSATTQNITGLNAGNYAVTVTDAAGCKGTAGATITTALPPGATICMVTVNPKTNYNTLTWDSINPNKIQEYLIYRQTTTPGIYNVIGHSAGNSGRYIDTLSNAGKRSWWYEISELDSCGQSSPISAGILFKTIHLTATVNANGSVSLVWDNFEGATFQRYIIYRDSVPGVISDSIAWVDTNTFGYVDHPPFRPNWYYHVGIGGTFGCSLVPKMSHQVQSINYNASKSNTGNITFSTTAIQTISSVNSLNVYPNPTRGLFTLSLDLDKQQNVRVNIYDALGRAIESDNYGAQSGKVLKQFDLSAFSKGIYTVQVITGDGVTYRKVVIQ